jgi:histidine triad (HIT) family protein
VTEYDPDNVFARIIRGEIPSDRVYEDEEFIAFRDIAPMAPVHVLVIPRERAIVGPAGIEADDSAWVGRMIAVANRIASDLGLAEGGYRLVMNNGDDAGQEVQHLHLHILGGKRLGPFA